jgi:hypothetical protein
VYGNSIQSPFAYEWKPYPHCKTISNHNLK